MRGEHVTVHAKRCQSVGSSPHARGTQIHRTLGRHVAGIIPACAGNTSSSALSAMASLDHPRMRGEHAFFPDERKGIHRSSPHARGTRIRHDGGLRGLGIIPACAGNTTSHDGKTCPHPYHPRMRGEHDLRGRAHDMDAGSSPHARGTLTNAGTKADSAGIIPACAGNTASASILRLNPRDHPRMRGEHQWPAKNDEGFEGSSPHARGTLAVKNGRFQVFGIIPACAGNTQGPTTTVSATRDHPRMRGEHPACIWLLANCWGSSPHARGTLHHGEIRPARPGIIPACAGNTSVPNSSRTDTRDHPRMRGEHKFRQGKGFFQSGSSPHARGTRRIRRAGRVRPGIIPACAGNTRRIVPG